MLLLSFLPPAPRPPPPVPALSRYDSLTGVPSCQRTVAFEKASVLFNIAALYTQIGTRQDRRSVSEELGVAPNQYRQREFSGGLLYGFFSSLF